MTRSFHLRTSRAAGPFHAAFFVALALSFSTLFACIAPAHPPATTTTAEEPYESMSASIAMGNPDAALSSYEKALASKPQSNATRVLHGRLLMIAGKLDEAREEFNLVLAADDRNTDALYNLSLVAGLQDRLDEQESLLHQVVAIDPNYADALAALGDNALGAGDATGAITYYDRALAADARNIGALIGSGEIQSRAKAWAAAAELFTRALVVQPDYPFAYIDRAQARAAMSDADGALDDLSKAISIDPHYSWSYIDRGKIYAARAHEAEAIADFDVALKLDPDEFEGYALRADARASTGDTAGAIADWNHVVSLKPDYGYAYAPLAELEWKVGDWTRARAAFLQAYQFDAGDHSLALCAALCALLQGKSGDVTKLVEPVLAQVPADSWQHDVARLLVDRGFETAFLGRVDRERNSSLKARLLFYAAMNSFAAGLDRVGLTYLTQIDGKGAPSAVETDLARSELARRNTASGN